MGQTRVASPAGSPCRSQRLDRFFKRHRGIGAGKPQIYVVRSHACQCIIQGGQHVASRLRPAHTSRIPAGGAPPDQRDAMTPHAFQGSSENRGGSTVAVGSRGFHRRSARGHEGFQHVHGFCFVRVTPPGQGAQTQR